MPKHTENSSWKQKPTDIAYKEPFSDSTNKTRKLLILWASIALLNHFYPIDLENSHVLGLRFTEGTAPPIDGLLGMIVIYLFAVLAIYVFQEITSWLAQADALAFEQHQRLLLDIYSHHGNIHNQIKSATQQISNHATVMSKLNESLMNMAENDARPDFDDSLMGLRLHKESFENMCANLNISNEKYGEEIKTAYGFMRKAKAEYKAALATQLFKVGILEIMLPFTLGVFAAFFSYEKVISLIQVIAS